MKAYSDDQSVVSSDTNSEGSFKERIRMKVSEKVIGLKNKVITSEKIRKVTDKYHNLMRKRENPDFLIRLDEYKHSFGIMSILFTFSLLFYPDPLVLATWISVSNMILLTLRYFEFRNKDWQYYYFDYCYSVNVATWVFIWVYPKSCLVFFAVAINGMCPILNFFIIFSPKLIFQSRDAITSFFMHYTPTLLFWILRYFNTTDDHFVTAKEAEKFLYEGGWRKQVLIFVSGMAFYVAWLAFYYVNIFHIWAANIKKYNYPTLYSYTKNDMKLFSGLADKIGEKRAPFAYLAFHFVQGFIGSIMSMVVLNFKKLSVAILLVYLLFPVWNSSVYYFEYFSKDYNTKVKRRADNFRENRIKRSSSVGRRAPAESEKDISVKRWDAVDSTSTQDQE